MLTGIRATLVAGVRAGIGLGLLTVGLGAGSAAMAQEGDGPRPMRINNDQAIEHGEVDTGLPDIGGTARILIDTSAVDFGTVWDHERPEKLVTFRNVGDGVLRLSDERGSCGCTVPEISPRELAPGQEGVLKIRFNPEGRRGPQLNKRIDVRTNDPRLPEFRIELSVEVKPVLRVLPQGSVGLGRVEVNTTGSRRVTFFGRGEEFAVTPARDLPGRAEHPFVVERVTVEDPIPPAMAAEGFTTRVDFDIVVPPGVTAGLHSSMVPFATTDERRPLVDVRASVQVLPDIVSRPAVLVLGRVEEKGPVNQEFLLISQDAEPFEVRGISALGPMSEAEFSYEPVDERRDAWRVTVSGNLGAAAQRRVAGSIRVSTDRPAEPLIQLGYRGFIPARRPQAAGTP